MTKALIRHRPTDGARSASTRRVMDPRRAHIGHCDPLTGLCNGAVFDLDVQRAELLRELRMAVRHGELQLHYQPKVDGRSRALVGVEALLRWTSPSRGPVSPAEFIPLAERSGLIHEIGEYVLFEACRQIRRWLAAGCPAVAIAINLSAHQFQRDGLLANIETALASNSLGAESIEFELTESVLVADWTRARTTLTGLRNLGVKTAIDDFGTGFSSLSTLRQHRFDTLKIDRSFVASMHHDATAMALVEGIISIGHALDMQVVAEGVEDAAQLETLIEFGCNTIQGNFTGRPVCGETVQALLCERVA